LTKERVICSIGHSTRGIEDFLSLLDEHVVELVVDVRRFPASRRHPQFNRAALARALGRLEIGYVHLGEDLGGEVDGEYERYVRSAAFRRGLVSLDRLAGERRTVFMCAEKLPWKCHRRFIARELAQRGWRVVHILDRGQVWESDDPLFGVTV
jgi:uncharacterized protein (DUF488 family)